MTNPEEEQDNPIISKDVTVSETLHKTTEISTRNYILNGLYRGENDEGEIDADFSDTNWLEEYQLEHYTLEQLLTAIPKFLESILPMLLYGNRQKALEFIRECKGWTQDEIEAVI